MSELEGVATNWDQRHRRRIYCDVPRDKLVDAVKILRGEPAVRFSTASGTDMREAVEILYHFSIDCDGYILSLRVTLPKDDLKVDSLAPLMNGAVWIEREMREMLGVEFTGNPDQSRLLLADDWPQGDYPLRHDGKGREGKKAAE